MTRRVCECLPGELAAVYQQVFHLEDENDRLREEVLRLYRLLSLSAPLTEPLALEVLASSS